MRERPIASASTAAAVHNAPRAARLRVRAATSAASDPKKHAEIRACPLGKLKEAGSGVPKNASGRVRWNAILRVPSSASAPASVKQELQRRPLPPERQQSQQRADA